MSSPLASVAINMPEYERRAKSARDLIRGFYQHDDLFQKIATPPQVGIYERFGKKRALCLSYIESEVLRKYEDVAEYINCVDDEDCRSFSDEQIREQFAAKMKSLIDELLLHGHFFDQCRLMAQATSPSSRSSRYHYQELHEDSTNSVSGINETENRRAPNGEDIAKYVPGDSATSFAVLVHENLDPIEQLLAYLCIAPFIEYVIWPFKKILYDRFKNRKTQVSQRDRIIPVKRISAIAKPTISVLATSSLAIAVSVLNSINDPNLRIVVMTLFGVAFALSASFFGQGSMATLQLITAYFQAMIFFVATSNGQQDST